jgi:basic amino acid/polyamine antiporter, APA family
VSAFQPNDLHRTLSTWGATIITLAAMLGTGVFVIWGPVIAWSGSGVFWALSIAACVAALNAWSSARLAMAYPQSGGSYAYGRILLNRTVGNAAGWAFIVGKCASAAAAALAIGTYIWPDHVRLMAAVAVVLALLIDMRGLRHSANVTGVLVGSVLLILLAFIGTHVNRQAGPELELGISGFGTLAAAALCFFAFAGYARITTLGEEIRNPRSSIPRAIAMSMVIVFVVYLGIAFVMLQYAQQGNVIGSSGVLEVVAVEPWLKALIQLAIVLAAGAALVALIAGMSRTVFAMSRAGDLPAGFAKLHGGVPRLAQVAVTVAVMILVAVGQLVWLIGLSAFSILLYYAVAHAAAWRLPPGQRPPRWVPVLGLVGCLVLALAWLWASGTGFSSR